MSLVIRNCAAANGPSFGGSVVQYGRLRDRAGVHLGSGSRNPVRGPAYRNLDLAMIRRVPLHGGRALELGTEIFNVSNTPPLGTPNGVFGSPAFGSITTAGDPRVVQLALKFVF